MEAISGLGLGLQASVTWEVQPEDLKALLKPRFGLTECRYLELTNLREIKSGESLSELLEVSANGGRQLRES